MCFFKKALLFNLVLVAAFVICSCSTGGYSREKADALVEKFIDGPDQLTPDDWNSMLKMYDALINKEDEAIKNMAAQPNVDAATEAYNKWAVDPAHESLNFIENMLWYASSNKLLDEQDLQRYQELRNREKQTREQYDTFELNYRKCIPTITKLPSDFIRK